MKVYQGLESFSKLDNAVVTTGTFDGVHIGHKQILKRVNEIAAKTKGESVLLTFYPHPRMVLQEDSDLKLLNTIEEKTELLREAGIQHLIIQPFTKEFSRTTSLEYVRDILVNTIGTKKLVIGYDHHFGRNREGSFEHLKDYGPIYGFEVEEISAQDIDDVKVSSTKIRRSVEEGDIETANTYSGSPYPISGVVIGGEKLGRQLGFPTANIKIGNKYKLVPPNGVYAVKVDYSGETFLGMMNIGKKPTFEKNGKQRFIEVHLLDFDADLYGEYLEIKLYKKIREEKKFDSKEELVAEIEKDEVRIRNYFENK